MCVCLRVCGFTFFVPSVYIACVYVCANVYMRPCALVFERDSDAEHTHSRLYNLIERERLCKSLWLCTDHRIKKN